MWSKVAVVLAVVAVAMAEGEWNYKPRRPTVTPNIKGLPFNQVVKEIYHPNVYIPGWKKVENCGLSKAHNDAKIVGGQEAVPNTWPWQVALYLDETYFCGGSIIDANWVLTAAHCTDGISSVRIVAGAHNVRQDEPTQATYISTDMRIHEAWGPALLRNDISLIYVAEGITFTPEIQPVCLPSRSQAPLGAGETVTPTGWGLDSDDAIATSSTLNQVTVPTMLSSTCAQTYSIVTEEILCIDTTGGKGTCSGDSGGPLNYDNGSGSYCTQGVTSFGASAGCEVGYPAGFTRLTSYLDWIETITGIIIG